MNLTANLYTFLKAPLSAFRLLQVLIALVCLFIPLLLKICDKDIFYRVSIHAAGTSSVKNCLQTVTIAPPVSPAPSGNNPLHRLQLCDPSTDLVSFYDVPIARFGYRISLSDYTYGSTAALFGFLYGLTVMLFLYNGVSYIKKTGILWVNRNGHWFNIFTGLSLAGVVFSPKYELPFLHNLFTILFFAGNIGTMLFAGNPGENKFFKLLRIMMALLVIGILWFTFKTKKLSVLEAEWIALFFFGVHLVIITITSELFSKAAPSS